MRKYEDGKILKIELSDNYYQIISYIGDVSTPDIVTHIPEMKGLYYVRKIFNKKMQFKLEDAEVVHETWLHEMRADKREALQAIIDGDPQIKAALSDLTIHPMHCYGSVGGFYIGDQSVLPLIEREYNATVTEPIRREEADVRSRKICEKYGLTELKGLFNLGDYPLVYRVDALHIANEFVIEKDCPEHLFRDIKFHIFKNKK